jgi:isopenicillin N synthase-like dioxygenase
VTGGVLHSTPHLVAMNTRERFSVAYFREPAFDADFFVAIFFSIFYSYYYYL